MAKFDHDQVLYNSATLLDSYSLHIYILTFCLAE